MGEFGDVKHGLERCVIETTECQGELKELRAQVAAESLQHQEQFKAHVKYMSETLDAKILESQELKTNTRLYNDTAVQESPRFGSVVTPRLRLIRPQQSDNCVRATGSVQRVGGLVPPTKAAPTQSCIIKPSFRTSTSTPNL